MSATLYLAIITRAGILPKEIDDIGWMEKEAMK